MIYLKKLFSATSTAIVGLVLYATFPVWPSIFSSTPTDFSVENWHAAHKYRREAMAKDFLARHPYLGMHCKEVIRLLGKPDSQSLDELLYFVSVTAGDYMALSFKFESDCRVVRAYIRQT